jgi:thioredoxin-like negative regulator of GroEL/energy-coupling factor transporter ATP-binding protein EcfA2
MPSPNLRDLLVQLAQALTDQPDVPAVLIHALREAGENAVRDEAINIGGDQITAAGGSVVINRSDHAQVIINRPDAATLVSAILQVRQQMADDQAAKSRQHINEYLTAMRGYCASLPYLTLHDVRPPKILDEVYVPLRARPQQLNDKKDETGEEVEAHEVRYTKTMSIADVMRNHERPHVLVLGEPGSGKSTLLRQMAERAWNDPESIGLDMCYLPILVPLWRLTRADGSLESRLARVLSSELAMLQDLPQGFFTDWPVQTGANWLILLDALDEVPSDDRARLMQWLNSVLNSIGQHRVVVTSRPSGYAAGDLNDQHFGFYDLLPFTPRQTVEFARKWFHDRASDFLGQLERVRAGDLHGTPLLLTIAATVYLDRNGLPERRSGLYEQFVNMWLSEADRRNLQDRLGSKLAGPVDLQLARFSHLAFRMTETSEDTSLRVLAGFVAEYLRDEEGFTRIHAATYGRRFVEVMAQHSGFFVRRARNYDFVHPTFREFLAAAAVVYACKQDLECVWTRGASHWQDDDWREVVLFILGILSDEGLALTTMLQSILDTDQDGLYFVVESLAEGIVVNEVLKARLVDSLVDAARQMSLQELRWKPNAVSALNELRGDEAAIQAMVTLARDEEIDEVIRLASIDALRKQRQTGELSKMVLDRQLGPRTRSAANVALKVLGSGDLLGLAHVAEGSEDQQEVDATSTPLGEQDVASLGEVDRTHDLLKIIRNRSLPQAERHQALAELAESYRPQQLLLSLVLDDEMDVGFRVRSANILAQRGSQSEATRALKALAFSATVDSSEREKAAEMLCKLGCLEEATGVLFDLARTESIYELVRERAAMELCNLGHAENALPILFSLARDTRRSDIMRFRISETVRQLGYFEEASEILLLLAYDGRASASVLDHTASALLQAGYKDEAVRIWTNVGVDSKTDPNVRYTAAESLQKLGYANEAIQVWLALACDTEVNEVLRCESARVLKRCGHVDAAMRAWVAIGQDRQVWPVTLQEAVEALIELFWMTQPPEWGHEILPILSAAANDETADSERRINAASALGKLNQVDEYAAILLKVVHDVSVSDRIRVKATKELARLGQVESLWKLARGEEVDASVRVTAAEELGKLGWVDEATHILLEVAHDVSVSDRIRVKATKELGRLGQVESLWKLARGEEVDASVRVTAATELGKLNQVDESTAILLEVAHDVSVRNWIRVKATKELARLGQVESLWKLARGEEVDASVRVTAAEELGKLGWVDEAAHILLEVAHDVSTDPSVRWDAAMGLEILGRIDEAEPILDDIKRDALP